MCVCVCEKYRVSVHLSVVLLIMFKKIVHTRNLLWTAAQHTFVPSVEVKVKFWSKMGKNKAGESTRCSLKWRICPALCCGHILWELLTLLEMIMHVNLMMLLVSFLTLRNKCIWVVQHDEHCSVLPLHCNTYNNMITLLGCFYSLPTNGTWADLKEVHWQIVLCSLISQQK